MRKISRYGGEGWRNIYREITRERERERERERDHEIQQNLPKKAVFEIAPSLMATMKVTPVSM